MGVGVIGQGSQVGGCGRHLMEKEASQADGGRGMPKRGNGGSDWLGEQWPFFLIHRDGNLSWYPTKFVPVVPNRARGRPNFSEWHCKLAHRVTVPLRFSALGRCTSRFGALGSWASSFLSSLRKGGEPPISIAHKAPKFFNSVLP